MDLCRAVFLPPASGHCAYDGDGVWRHQGDVLRQGLDAIDRSQTSPEWRKVFDPEIFAWQGVLS
jgi:hypothetical protein